MTDEEVRWKSTANDAFQTVLAGFTLRYVGGLRHAMGWRRPSYDPAPGKARMNHNEP